ncbi:MAG TPA: carbohydrate ABC transporter permease [Candidatus Hydrogenedentes bacterium]|nr:carbohydrate ABC transporter permease [Candidatus Hydrogenedentota bacterium]
MRLSHSTQQQLLRIAAYVFLAVMAVLFMFPFYWLFVSAFKAKDQIFSLPPVLWPDPWRFSNFAAVFEKTHIVQAFINSVVIACGHCTLALFLCSLAGFAFAKYPHAPGRDKLFAFVLATMMIPGAVTLIPVFVVLCKLHAINTYWAMIVPGAASAFGIFWMRQYTMENVHNDLLDAARIDGCSEFRIYWSVVLPVLKPAMAALGIILLIGSWNNLMWAFIVLRTTDMYTLPLVIYLLNGENRTPFEMIMAASVLATLPLVIAFLFFQRQFIAGITAGAIKG